MLFKELQAAQQKFLPVLFGYILVGLLLSTVLGPARNFTSISIFHQWVQWMLLITIGVAILGGADTISEENGKNTLSFLLTRPVSRTTIYTLKFGVSAVFLSAIFLITSLVMFGVEQLPQGYQFGGTSPGGDTVYTYVSLDKMSAHEAFANIGFFLGLGLVVLAFTTVVSIFTRSAITAVVTTILFIVGLVALYAVVDTFLYGYRLSSKLGQFFDIYRGFGLIDFFLLVTLAAGVYFVGLWIFRAKEF